MVELYTEAKVSPVGKVNKADLVRWSQNLILYLIPLALLYVAQLNGGIQDGILSGSDFTPTLVTLGGMQLYVLNSLTDLLRKFSDSKK